MFFIYFANADTLTSMSGVTADMSPLRCYVLIMNSKTNTEQAIIYLVYHIYLVYFIYIAYHISLVYLIYLVYHIYLVYLV